jgi:hypothetical protein
MKANISKAAILSERLRRQRLIDPLKNLDEYPALFELAQPASPIHFTEPGSPPSLVHRTTFDDWKLANPMRAEHVIVKGRFLSGRIGYVLAKDLELYAVAFRRPLAEMSETQYTVFDRVKYLGPLTPRQIKAETGLLNKTIMPALHRLQEAFLVYEDQIDSDWEREWHEFAAFWPDIDLESAWAPAAAEVLRRFLRAHVFATLEQLKDWSGFASKALKRLVADMEKSGSVAAQTAEGLGEGWMLPEDMSLQVRDVSPAVFMLHKSDILVRAHASELKRRFGDLETLQYLLIDGEFRGAVLGHWRIGPHDVEDIAVELPAAERARRKAEILRAVAWGYHPPRSRILKYDGKAV